ncbi:MAG: hypothetical protein KatS3mg111_3880 [Pirellulaceae bacterium]|nr:MAG: hypothetical protein KatS3mg111_3880 [Pirellulaceae bacterium]
MKQGTPSQCCSSMRKARRLSPNSRDGRCEVFIAVFIFGIICGATLAADTTNWSEPGHCGLNSLYCFLRVSGIEVRYDELALHLPIDPVKGSSMEDLERVAEQFGVHADILLVEPAKIADLPVPFILHLELLDQGAAGHFVTVLQVDERDEGGQLVRFFDGNTARLTHQQLDLIARLATGYVLIDSDQLNGFSDVGVIVYGVGIGLASAMVMFWLSFRRLV